MTVFCSNSGKSSNNKEANAVVLHASIFLGLEKRWRNLNIRDHRFQKHLCPCSAAGLTIPLAYADNRFPPIDKILRSYHIPYLQSILTTPYYIEFKIANLLEMFKWLSLLKKHRSRTVRVHTAHAQPAHLCCSCIMWSCSSLVLCSDSSLLSISFMTAMKELNWHSKRWIWWGPAPSQLVESLLTTQWEPQGTGPTHTPKHNKGCPFKLGTPGQAPSLEWRWHDG